MKRIKIFDTTLRDGEQSPGCSMNLKEKIEMARQLIKKEGIFAGMSSGAAMLAAYRTAEKISSGNIVVLFPDRAEKYISTIMFEPYSD